MLSWHASAFTAGSAAIGTSSRHRTSVRTGIGHRNAGAVRVAAEGQSRPGPGQGQNHDRQENPFLRYREASEKKKTPATPAKSDDPSQSKKAQASSASHDRQENPSLRHKQAEEQRRNATRVSMPRLAQKQKPQLSSHAKQRLQRATAEDGKRGDSGKKKGGDESWAEHEVDIEGVFASNVEDKAREIGYLVQGKLQEKALVLGDQATIVKKHVKERVRTQAAEMRQTLQEKTLELQEKALELQEKAVDAGSLVQERASSVAETLQEELRLREIERAVQEKALEVEKMLPLDTQKAIRKVAKRTQQVASVAVKKIDELPVTRTQFGAIVAGVLLLFKVLLEWHHHAGLDAR